MNNVFFISGIDTDCGKTYITGKLAKKLKQAGKNVITHKLIQTGCKGISDDILEHRKIMGIDLLDKDKRGLTCPYVMSFPSSPHLAAEIDNVKIDINRIYESIEKLADNFELVLSEGAGGLMVPITTKYLTIEFIKDNELKLILVTSSKLGSINQTLLSLAACKKYDVQLKGVIYNHFPEHDKRIANSTFHFIDNFMKEHFPGIIFSNKMEPIEQLIINST